MALTAVRYSHKRETSSHIHRCSALALLTLSGVAGSFASVCKADDALIETHSPHNDFSPAIDTSATRESPPYKIIPRPLPKHVAKKTPYSTDSYPSPSTVYQVAPTHPYSYGWFGPKDTPRWYRQFGFNSHYTQWTLK